MRRIELNGEALETAVTVSFQEAQAVERCLKTEADVRSETLERLRVIHFARRAPRAVNDLRDREHLLQVRLVERSTHPDAVTIELVRVLSDEVRRSATKLPRRVLRAALRPNARAELFPDLPADYAPVVAVESTRRTWRHASGWRLSIDRDLALHRIDPDMLERLGQLALGVPDRCVNGRAVVALDAGGLMVPPWLEYVLKGGQRWNVLSDALSLIAPRPAPRGPGRDLKLVPTQSPQV